MTQTTLPNYREFDQILSQIQSEMHPAQVHGLLCGVLSGDMNTNVLWEELIAIGQPPMPVQSLLQDLLNVSFAQLNEFLFDFQLLLPPDSESLPVRAEALTLWCQGYLTGLKMAGIQLTGRGPGEMTEAINDLVEIAKMNHEDVVASEEDEAAYVELVEFVRMAAILIYEEIRENEAPKAAPPDHTH